MSAFIARTASVSQCLLSVYGTQNHPAMRLRELQTWTEVAREKNMIVVTGGGGDQQDLGSLLGIVKERTPVTEQVDEKRIREVVRKELGSIVSVRAEGRQRSRWGRQRQEEGHEAEPQDNEL